MKSMMIVMLAMCLCVTGTAQVPGDYQSVASGKWSSVATWQMYSGSAWVAATTAPTGTGTITLRAADSVDIDVAVTVSGTLKSLGGKWGYSTGSLTFGDGAVYEHAANGASIPTATWGTGSTCLITGAVANSPSNANQDFYNFTWNCPGQTSGTSLNVAWMNTTIRGNLRVTSTNNTGTTTAFRMTNNAVPAPGVNTITILGDVFVDSTTAYLTTTGSSGADSIRVIVGGDILSKGVLNLANGSGATCAWYVSGNVSLLAGAFTTHSSTSVPDSLIFAGPGIQKFVKAGEITTLSNVRFRVLPGTLLDLDTNDVGNSNGSTFTLDAGASILTQHPSGLGGNLTNKLATTLSPDASYLFRGPVAQVDTLMPGTVKYLTINNNVGVTFKKPLTINSTLTLAVGALSAESNVITALGTVNRTFGFVTSPFQKPVATSALTTFDVGTAGGYAPVTILASAGSGTMTVTPAAGTHPNWPAATKGLSRSWTLSASGITQADLTFSYPAADAKGVESTYRAYRYTGSSWAMAAGSVNTTSHTVTATGVTGFSDWTCGESGAVAVGEETPEIPKEFFVDQNYPNPFNPSTTITYGLPHSAVVKAELFSLLGQKVATLFEGEQEAGIHKVSFTPATLSSGMYLYRIQAGSSVAMKRMIYVR